MYCFSKDNDRFEFVEKIVVEEIYGKSYLKLVTFLNHNGKIGDVVILNSMVKDFLNNNIISSDMLEDWED